MKMSAFLIVGAIATLIFLPPASATTTSNAVNVAACGFSGGQTTLPAGEELVTRTRWLATTRGLVEDYLSAQTTTLSINGGPLIDLTEAYAPPTQLEGLWATIADYSTGIVLAAGESVTVTETRTLAHRILDGASFVSGHDNRPFFYGPLIRPVCTVTGI